MHSRLAELVEYAEAQREALLAAVEAIPEQLRSQRTEPDCWSVAEVLEHLHRVERGISRLAAQGIGRARTQGLAPERSTDSMLGSLDPFHIEQRSNKVAAPGVVAPRGELSASEALEALRNSRQALLAALSSGNGLALGEITHPHPLLGGLNLYQWVLFVGQHEARHADQIREIGARLTQR